MLLGLRPEHLRPGQDGSTESTTFVTLKVASHAVTMVLARCLRAVLGEPMRIGFDPADLHIFDGESETALTMGHAPS